MVLSLLKSDWSIYLIHFHYIIASTYCRHIWHKNHWTISVSPIVSHNIILSSMYTHLRSCLYQSRSAKYHLFFFVRSFNYPVYHSTRICFHVSINTSLHCPVYTQVRSCNQLVNYHMFSYKVSNPVLLSIIPFHLGWIMHAVKLRPIFMLGPALYVHYKIHSY